MKVYLVYETNSRELQLDGCNEADIIGIFDSLEKAQKCKKERINNGIKDGYIIDEELGEEIEECKSVIMFSGYQENWDRHYTIIIDERELL